MEANQKSQEDPLAPTPVNNNHASKNTRFQENLSHEELKDRLDAYSQVGGSHEQYFSVQRMKQEYLKEIEQLQKTRSKQDVFYGLGQRAGLPHSPLQTLNLDREDLDQKRRDEIAHEAKSFYDKNENLRKPFYGTDSTISEMKREFSKGKDSGPQMDH